MFNSSDPKRSLGRKPIRLLLVSFLALIGLGALALKLPWATPQGLPIGWVDALFTATSAACVTGLAVRDTGSGFTGFGQGVILVLIQLGGMGMMTFSLFVFTLLRGRISLAHRSVVESTLAGPAGATDIAGLLRLVVRFTLVTEGLGAAALTARFAFEMPWPTALWKGVFHSISAFCNAGFALQPDSLSPWRADPVVNLVVMALVVAGGIGFLVVFDLWEMAREIRHRPVGRRRRSLSLHSKVVLVVTGVLLVGGALVLYLLERRRLLAGMGPGEALLVSLFQSVTTRTAGFNTVDLVALSPGTLFTMILLMFVGGSPGSTAGGLKTTTLAVLALAAWSRLRGRKHINAFRRTLGTRTVGDTLSIAMAGIVTVVVALFVLLLAETPGSLVRENRAVFFDYLFETVSALATVGLSTGVTASLHTGGRLLVTLMMYLGRLGPLTVATALVEAEPLDDWQYPEENVMVG
jgi:trk system potassium uptake protein TrkH